MKTIFFSAIESPNLVKEHDLTAIQGSTEHVAFNTPHIMSPHDVLSAIKVSVSINPICHGPFANLFAGLTNFARS